ncbi:MAG: SMP-30/gluconolactonase/LRE family protein [Gemmatimonadota bacterium]|nr:SMP-30/gluconolactonase/LRE family protein [Gemmatimonadota bacterium]
MPEATRVVLPALSLILLAASCTPAEPDAGGPVPLPDNTVTMADVGFATPESVLHDNIADLYIISNINGAPLEADGNGFISRVSPMGDLQLKWIDGATPGVTLNAPKGMATLGDNLYVADINTLRWFDRSTGEPKGQLEIPGATFLNDVVAHPDGGVYVSDTGMRAGAGGFEPAGTDAIYRLNPDMSLDTLARGEQLGHPNGLALSGDSLYVVTFGSGEFYRLENGAMVDVVKLPKGTLDGLVIFGRMVFISSWEGSSIFRGTLGGDLVEALSGVPAPADIGHDPFQHRLLIPLFQDNTIKLVPLAF